MAHKIKKILFTSDLSKDSIEVFEQTAVLALQVKASVSMLHVIEEPKSANQVQMIHLIDPEIYEEILRETRESIKYGLIGKQKGIALIKKTLRDQYVKTSMNICGNLSLQVDVIEVRYGNAAEVIAEYSESEHFDLIIIGLHWNGPSLRSITKNTSRKVLTMCKKLIYLVPCDP